MSEVLEVKTTLDVTRLARWMDRQGLAGEGETPDITQLTGGSQNELFLVSRGGKCSALRMPPPSADAKRQDGLRRELTLLSALKGADVPHAELVAGCVEADVLGMPFYLMEVVDGWSPSGADGWPEPYATRLTERAPLAFGLVEGAAKLSRVDWKGRGLEGFGRPDNFHDRQVDRWLSFLSNYKFRDLPGLDEASAWLRNNRPRHWEPGIMHGDYQFANVMFSNRVPTDLAAVIDWEMTTIGDPLLDLAWALLAWGPEGDDMTFARYLDLDEMPSLDDLLEHYETISGRSTEDFNYYLVLARWKLGIVLEMSYARFASGAAANPSTESFGNLVLELIRKAAELSRALTTRAS
ncbi:acyl-CoA dehydrogenase [Nocardioides sp. Soil777]|uniref:phosphotransferase family protein n=1 Tax=Nocardioides sp. Soil777 TaxID=1736409 RepID=UPI000702A7A3|nr:phosphotransferase family protein [Nocardioides sp. Soil777]KRE98002.1 acyl-CoA dehydrogenase [Nocardioides sp. Soil777]